MDPHIRNSPGSRTLAQLGQVIGSQEVILGRFLGAIMAGSETNFLAFAGVETADDLPGDGQQTRLEFIDGHPQEKAGSALVWFGTVLVGAEPRLVAAYRPL
ncbi:hypothetical protein [Neoroseomonas soli]|uniref:Uncharacterized protein n=1 Tax=Neoroseomonas soli TaxID=1081025 RepID=A0A9X9WXZ9_9PROT|nr:hypothetical protein [Neoroseomonas soli]MBR0672028.1 hypothetical protein [Neoroseomonas soli]